MILTVEEAKKLWCPMDEFASNCHVDKCPMWRWFKPPIFPGDTDPDTERPYGENEFGPNKGFCGLAGRPTA